MFLYICMLCIIYQFRILRLSFILNIYHFFVVSKFKILSWVFGVIWYSIVNDTCPLGNKIPACIPLVCQYFIYFFCVLLEFELRASHLLGRGSTTWAHCASPFLCWIFSFFFFIGSTEGWTRGLVLAITCAALPAKYAYFLVSCFVVLWVAYSLLDK
jgi:hypothetical protein